MDRPDVLENITAIRREEMDRAREILGVRQDWLGFVDSGWPEGDPQPPLPEGCFALVPVEEAAEPLVRLIRELPAARHDDLRRERRLPAPRPHHVPPGQRGGVRGGRRPGPLPRRRRALAAAEALLPPLASTASAPRRCTTRWSPAAWSRPTPSGSRSGSPTREHAARITTRVPCAEYFPVRDRALLAHATQIDPDGAWFACPLDVHQEAWPTEDYELARSPGRRRDARGRSLRRRPRGA